MTLQETQAKQTRISELSKLSKQALFSTVKELGISFYTATSKQELITLIVDTEQALSAV